jgi:hypothetical protein
MIYFFLLLLLILAPCDILTNKLQSSSRIEFNENTRENTVLFELPFDTTSSSQNIVDIKFKSNELNETMLNQYFDIIDLKKFILKTTYDLDEIQIDLIELLFTCTLLNTNNNNNSQLSISNTFLVYVTINDVNDNRPQFLSTPYKFQIKEVILI